MNRFSLPSTKGLMTSLKALTVLCALASCQTEELTSGSNASDNKKAYSTEANQATPVTSGNYNTDCIKGGVYFPTTDQQMVTYGNSSKTVYVKYYNTESDFVVEVKSTNGWSELLIDGVDVWNGTPVAANVWQSISMPLNANWNVGDNMNFRLTVVGNGPQNIFNINYNLFGECQEETTCATAFTGQAISCGSEREAVYTFTADKDLEYIKIQGGLTNFTGSNAVVTVNGGNLHVTQSTPGGSSNRIIKIEGSVAKCEKVTVNVKWNSTNTGGIITGSWSVSANGEIVVPNVEGLICE